MIWAVDLAGPARRQLAEELPEAVAAAAANFLCGALAENPHRVGKQLEPPLFPAYSARRGDYRVIYLIDDAARRVIVKSIRHRSRAYRT
ncbi:MAG: type II toxin-antitoxin system RelE/ParE family toxin [Bifidobacteriaceae bacterium]|nr:type II toxin-antitoxin system RelE/ParE family toxin [Bifidobacteriaceae bacterium]